MAPTSLTIEITPDAAETINVRRFEFMEALVGAVRGHAECIEDLKRMGAKVVDPAAAILSERDRATAAERARCTGLAEDAAEQALRAFGGFTAINAAAFMEGKFRALLAAIRNPMEGRGSHDH